MSVVVVQSKLVAVYIQWSDKGLDLLRMHFHPNTDPMNKMAVEYMREVYMCLSDMYTKNHSMFLHHLSMWQMDLGLDKEYW